MKTVYLSIFLGIMSNESKKRRRSCQRPEENQLEAKRIKLEPESMQSVEEGLSEHYIVKKKKKHKHHHSEINEVTEYLKAETPDMLQDGGCNINRLLEDDFESRPGKKHKHHRHRGNDTVVKSVETSDRYGLISEETAETESVNRSQTYATETVSSHKKKKKKKLRHYDEEDCHPQSEVELKQELVVPTDDSHSTDAAGNRVLESLTCDELDIDMSTQSLNCDTGKKKKKKKKKHVSQDYEGVQAVNAVKYEDMESELPLSDNGTSSWSSQAKSVSLQRQAETSCLLPCVKERCETHRPLQLHINTEEMRFEMFMVYLINI
jgi:hypothetical protein